MCEKLQAAVINPCSVNPIVCTDLADFGHSNPSLSSDDTLATSTVSPVLGDYTTASNSSKEDIPDSTLLVGDIESTDAESEDGLNFSTSLLGEGDREN